MGLDAFENRYYFSQKQELSPFAQALYERDLAAGVYRTNLRTTGG